MSKTPVVWGNVPGIFRHCVSEGSGRFDIDRPWTDGEFVYATDGAIAVRGPRRLGHKHMPDREATKEGRQYFFPPMDWWPVPGSFSLTPLPLVKFPGPPPTPPKCSECGGLGLCNKCKCGTEHKCGACNGEGTVSIKWLPVVFGSIAISEKYVRAIQDCGCRIFPPKVYDRPKMPYRFQHTANPAVEGVVMPWRPGYEADRVAMLIVPMVSEPEVADGGSR